MVLLRVVAGDKTGSSWWNTLATIAQLNKATKEQIACQAPKPILVDSSTVRTGTTTMIMRLLLSASTSQHVRLRFLC